MGIKAYILSKDLGTELHAMYSKHMKIRRPRNIHLGETGLYILDYVHARVFTSAKIEYYRMQWPKRN
jgi:hypothetical protein